jgi:RNA polymerase sigma-70 factor (ECF subfamily)
MERLNQRLGAGEVAAFGELYDELADRLFHYLLTQTGSREDAADVLQITFARLYRLRARFGSVENVTAYCFRAAHNEYLRWRGSREKLIELKGDELFEAVPDTREAEIETNELVARALSRLPGNFREVIELKFFGQLTFTQIALVLNKRQGTVATWYRRALEQLRRDNDFDQRD